MRSPTSASTISGRTGRNAFNIPGYVRVRARTGPPEAQTAPGAPQAYRESIAGTVVTFEMVPVPGGTVTLNGQSVEVKPFLIGRTEVTWDMYDVYALGLDEPKGGGGTDAVARPSQPYGAPDYGWGHAGYPAISIARPAAQPLPPGSRPRPERSIGCRPKPNGHLRPRSPSGRTRRRQIESTRSRGTAATHRRAHIRSGRRLPMRSVSSISLATPPSG